jgi:hypothetical protein
MATKTGAGGQPQEYDAKTGEYGGGHRQNTSHSAILADQKRRDAARIYDTTNSISSSAKPLYLQDETLPRSVGAMWANYKIKMPDGTTARFVEGSVIHHKEVIAGKGCVRKIDEVKGLVRKYGGKEREWRKIKGIGLIEYSNGTCEEREIHWYEEKTAGKHKFKAKD